uniref:Uncharacterized protein n=1 Tax=Cyclopterus lumpus TaxID=8103 RepID=A0A8C2XD08_CYCLU
MVMPLADLRAIYELHFCDGVIVGSLKPKGCVRETFAWKHAYNYLSNEPATRDHACTPSTPSLTFVLRSRPHIVHLKTRVWKRNPKGRDGQAHLPPRETLIFRSKGGICEGKSFKTKHIATY